MTMYRTIPQKVEAAQFFTKPESMEELKKIGLPVKMLQIEGGVRLLVALEDYAHIGDYVVKSPYGTFYSCRPEVFEARHVLADQPDRDTPMPAKREIAKAPTRSINGGLFGKGTTIWFCPKCGMFNTPSHHYCWKCGQALTFDIPAARAGAHAREEKPDAD